MMKNISLNKKMVFALGLVMGAALVLIFTFAVPGKRTYVGEDIGKELKTPPEVTMPIFHKEKSPKPKEVKELIAKEKPSSEQGKIEETQEGTKLAKDTGTTVTTSARTAGGIPWFPISKGVEGLPKEQTVEEKKEMTPQTPPPEQLTIDERISRFYEQNKEYISK